MSFVVDQHFVTVTVTVVEISWQLNEMITCLINRALMAACN
jgi:hypothetical protein